MAFRRGATSSLPTRSNSIKNGGCRSPVTVLLLVSVCAPLVMLASRTTSLFSTGTRYTENVNVTEL